MTFELDIWRSAKLLVDKHGTNATIRAAQRADQLLAAGDIEGRARPGPASAGLFFAV